MRRTSASVRAAGQQSFCPAFRLEPNPAGIWRFIALIVCFPKVYLLSAVSRLCACLALMVLPGYICANLALPLTRDLRLGRDLVKTWLRAKGIWPVNVLAGNARVREVGPWVQPLKLLSAGLTRARGRSASRSCWCTGRSSSSDSSAQATRLAESNLHPADAA